MTDQPTTQPTHPSPFVALEHRDFRLLWAGQFIAEAGVQMQLVAINWHIYILTGSALALGLIGLMRAVPIVFSSLLGGVLADTHDRRRVLLAAQAASMVIAVALALLTQSGWISAGLIYLLAALAAGAMGFGGPVWQAIAPNLVSREHLTNAMSLINIMRQTARIVGPGLAGFVIAWRGVVAVYWINAASFLAVLLAFSLMRAPAQENPGAARLALSSIGEGIRFVRNTQILFSTMLLDFLGTFFASASALLPIFANEILRVGPRGLGMLYSAQSVGAVLAATAMSFSGDVKKKGALVLWAILIYAVATALFGASRSFPLSLVCLALVGAGDTVSTILRHTIRQLVTPDHLRGRMNSVIMIFTQGGPQLGNLEAGLVATWIGAPLSVVAGGIATLILVAAVAWRVPQLRQYRG
jgi:MFS family permease